MAAAIDAVARAATALGASAEGVTQAVESAAEAMAWAEISGCSAKQDHSGVSFVPGFVFMHSSHGEAEAAASGLTVRRADGSEAATAGRAQRTAADQACATSPQAHPQLGTDVGAKETGSVEEEDKERQVL